MRENIYVLPTKEFFHLQIKRNEAEIYVYDQPKGKFGEFLPYITLSSASTNGLINVNYDEMNNALLSYKSTKFFVFSIFIAVHTEESQPNRFSLRAITSKKHGLMFFKVDRAIRLSNNDRLEVDRDMAKNTALFLMMRVKNDRFTMDVGRVGAQRNSQQLVEWSVENGWSIPAELNGEKLAKNVSSLNISLKL